MFEGLRQAGKRTQIQDPEEVNFAVLNATYQLLSGSGPATIIFDIDFCMVSESQASEDKSRTSQAREPCLTPCLSALLTANYIASCPLPYPAPARISKYRSAQQPYPVWR
jgi:hypothetical protein